MKFLTFVVTLLIMIVGIIGCGGSSSGGGSANPFAGAYRSDFHRGLTIDTTLLIVVQTNGTTTAVISDSTGVLYKGTGTTTKAGALSATLTGSGTVNLTGNFVSGTTPSVNVQLSGAITDNESASQIATANVPPIVGTFNGTYSGGESGTFQVVVHNDGTLTGTAQTSGGPVSVSGTIDLSGGVTLNASGGAGTASWTGSFFFAPGQTKAKGSGTWTNPAASTSGTWTAQEL